MNGGTRRRTAGNRRRGNKRAGSSNKRRTNRRRQNGGFGGALAGIVQTALVPFGLYAAQKMVQKGKPKSRKHSRK